MSSNKGPSPAWVWHQGAWRAATLRRWEQDQNGAWWARVVWQQDGAEHHGKAPASNVAPRWAPGSPPPPTAAPRVAEN